MAKEYGDIRATVERLEEDGSIIYRWEWVGPDIVAITGDYNGMIDAIRKDEVDECYLDGDELQLGPFRLKRLRYDERSDHYIYQRINDR